MPKRGVMSQVLQTYGINLRNRAQPKAAPRHIPSHRLDKDWDILSSYFPPSDASRQIFDLSISLVQTSCGYAVPFYDFKGERDILKKFNEKAGKKGIQKYWKENNAKSLDGIITNIEKKNIESS